MVFGSSLLSTTKKKRKTQSWTPLANLSGSAHEKITFLRRRNDVHVHVRTVKTQITLVGGSRNYRQGVGVRDILTQQLTFFSLTILQRGPISRKTILFKVPEGGGGSTLFRVDPTFSWRGWGPFAYSNGNL